MVLVFQKHTAPAWNQSPALNPVHFSFTLYKIEGVLSPNLLNVARFLPLNGNGDKFVTLICITFILAGALPCDLSLLPNFDLDVSFQLTPPWKHPSSCLNVLFYGHLQYFSFPRNLQEALPETVLLPSWIDTGKWDATPKLISMRSCSTIREVNLTWGIWCLPCYKRKEKVSTWLYDQPDVSVSCALHIRKQLDNGSYKMFVNLEATLVFKS